MRREGKKEHASRNSSVYGNSVRVSQLSIWMPAQLVISCMIPSKFTDFSLAFVFLFVRWQSFYLACGLVGRIRDPMQQAPRAEPACR